MFHNEPTYRTHDKAGNGNIFNENVGWSEKIFSSFEQNENTENEKERMLNSVKIGFCLLI